MKTLYVYLDESGNFDFSNKGTEHFVLGAVTTPDPVASQARMLRTKYALLENGTDVEYFHASEDTQAIRDEVLDTICGMENIKFDFVVAEKRKTVPVCQNPADFYRIQSQTLLKWVFTDFDVAPYDQVVVVFDKALPKKERGYVEQAIKPELKKYGKPFRMYFHRTLSDLNGQIADYGAWSVFVSYERNERRPIRKLQPLIKSCFEIFKTGTRKYY